MAIKTDNAIWGKFRKRAEELRKASETIRKVSDEEKERIFKERSKKLSLPKGKSVDDKDLLRIVSFYTAGEFYGINVNSLQEVYEVDNITRIPSTPPVLSGLINYRGTVLTIINLRVLFNLQEDKVLEKGGIDQDRNKLKANSFQKILIINYAGAKAGIVIDRFDSLLELPIDSIQPVSSFFQEKNKIVKSEVRINNTPLLIIDSEELLNDKRLIVNEDV